MKQKVKYSVRVLHRVNEKTKDTMVCLCEDYESAEKVRSRIEEGMKSQRRTIKGMYFTVELGIESYRYITTIIVPMVDYVGTMPDEMLAHFSKVKEEKEVAE